MTISWLQSTTAPFAAYWTSLGQTSTSFTENDDNDPPNAITINETYRDAFSYSSNYSGTSITVSGFGPGEVTAFLNNQSFVARTGRQEFVTQIGSVSSSELLYPDGNPFYYQDRTTRLSTRSKQTSTTQTFTWPFVSSAVSVVASSLKATTFGESTNPQFTKVVSIYQTTKYNLVVASVPTTITREVTTQDSLTETFCGIDNTIFQCETSKASFLGAGGGSVAWTAPNSFSLSSFAISALSDLAGETVSRWTESRNAETVLASTAQLAGSQSVLTVSFAELTSEIAYTTTQQESTTRAYNAGVVFPAQSSQTNTTFAALAESTATVTIYDATTLTTAFEFYDGAWLNPTLTSSKWINSARTFTTGNGQVTWHRFSAIPTTLQITTQLRAANPEKPQGLGTATIPQNDFYAIQTSTVFTNNGEAITHEGNISITASKEFSAGVAFVDIIPDGNPERRRFVYSPVGEILSTEMGAFLDIGLGKTFWQPQGMTAYAGGRSVAIKTVMPGSYEISATNAEWSGTLSIYGRSASATFIPTNTEQESTTTSALFSVKQLQTTALIASTRGLMGGRPASFDTFMETGRAGFFVAPNGETATEAAFAESYTQSKDASFWSIVPAVAPTTATQSRTAISYAQARNNAPRGVDFALGLTLAHNL